MSDSNSSSAQSTSYTDSRMVLGEGANNAANGGQITNHTTNYALDGGAIQASYGFANNTVDQAFDFGRGALASNTSTTNAALNFATDAQTASYASSDRSQQYAQQTASDSLAFAQDANTRAIGVQRESLGVAADSMSQALAYGGKQTAVALDSLNSSANLVKDAYADAKGRGALTDYVLMAAIGVAALVAYGAIKN